MALRLAVFGLVVSAAPGQILTVSPAVITQCTNGLGRATLSWNSPLNVQAQVRVMARDGTPMTGLEPPNGSAETGNWVRDGMVFFLVNADGIVIDQVTARVNCGGTPDTTTAAFTSAETYFPLQVGNRWVYRTDSRLQTAGWTVWTLTRTVQIGSQTWFVLETRIGGSTSVVESAYRAGDNGQVYRMPDYPNDTREELWLDPDGGPLSNAVFQTQTRGVPVTTPFGQLPGMTYQSVGTLSLETGTFVKGLGLLSSTSDMTTGSSGGFLSSLSLVEARIGQATYYTEPAAAVSVSAETSTLDVTNKMVTNCAVPCYFTACGLGPGADPPDTWKPCFQARVRAGVAGADGPIPLEATVEFVDAGGASLNQQVIGLTATSPSGEAAAYTQIPLYSAPNVSLPPGEYRLNVTLRQSGADAGSASLPVTIK